MAKEFITAVEEKVEGGPQPVEIVLGLTTREDDGTETVERRTIVCYPPKDGQVALMMARMGRHSSMPDKIAGIIDFFVDILGEDDHQYVVGRLMERTDPFGIGDVTDIIRHLTEEWSKRPTK